MTQTPPPASSAGATPGAKVTDLEKQLADAATTGGVSAPPAVPYPATPGEVTGSGNKALAWLAAVLVLGLIGVIAYLMLTG